MSAEARVCRVTFRLRERLPTNEHLIVHDVRMSGRDCKREHRDNRECQAPNGVETRFQNVPSPPMTGVPRLELIPQRGRLKREKAL